MKTHFHLLVLVTILMVGCQQKNLPPVLSSGLLPVNGTELYYRILGEGEPILVLHGGPGMSHDYLLPQMSQLAENYQLIFFDQRSCGRSALNPDSVNLSMDQLVEDIDFLREHFDIEKVNLMGHSWGGLLAMWYARQYPENMNKLLLINSVGANQNYAHISDSIHKSRQSEEERQLYMNWLDSDEYSRGEPKAMRYIYRLSFQHQFYYPQFLDSLNLYIPKDFKERQKQMRGLYQDLRVYDLLTDMAKVSCPTLILHGKYEYTSLQEMEALAESLPNAELVSLPYCGHFSYIEAPEQFGRVVRNFLRRN
jgi:proline iminopeptidase